MSESVVSAALAMLDRVPDPCSVAAGDPLSIVELGLVEQVDFREGTLSVVLALTEPGCWYYFELRDSVTDAVSSLEGVESTRVSIDGGIIWSPDRIERQSESVEVRRRRLRLTDRPCC